MKAEGYVNEIFIFIDATDLISKTSLWEDRDMAIQDKYEKLNKENISKFSLDPQAKIGCKGKNKFWYGATNYMRVWIYKLD